MGNISLTLTARAQSPPVSVSETLMLAEIKYIN